MTQHTITFSGAPEGMDALLLAQEAAKAPVVFVARDDKRMTATQQALEFFAPDVPVFVFPLGFVGFVFYYTSC